MIRRVIARFEPSLPASAEPLTSKSAVLDGAGTAIRHRKKRRSCIYFFLLLLLRLLPVFGRGFVDIRGRRRAGALRCSCRTGCGEWSLQCNLHGAVSRRCRLVGGGAVRGAEGRHFLRVEERKLRT